MQWKLAATKCGTIKLNLFQNNHVGWNGADVTKARHSGTLVPFSHILTVSEQILMTMTIGRTYHISLQCFEIIRENDQDFIEKRVKRFLWSNISLLVIKESAKPLLVRRKNVSAYWISHIIVDHMVEWWNWNEKFLQSLMCQILGGNGIIY